MNKHTKRMVLTLLCLAALGIYKVALTLYTMDRLGLDRADMGQDFKPIASDLEFSAPDNFPLTFATNDFSVAIVSSVTNCRSTPGSFRCEMDDASLRFVVLVKREDLLQSLPGLKNLTTDQILEKIYTSDSSDIYFSLSPAQITRSVALYRLKTMMLTTLCEQEWHSVLYDGRKCFVAVGPTALSIDVPSTDGSSYIHLFARKPDMTFADASLLTKILVSQGVKGETF